MATQDEHLRSFGVHCRAFYDASLILHPSSSSLSSMHGEEKKADEERAVGADDKRRRAADGKAVLEALDRIGSMCSIEANRRQQPPPPPSVGNALESSMSNLRQEHALAAERHHDLLAECGLVDVDNFIEDSNASDDDLFHKYTRIRDAMRRRSHKISMLHRQNSLFDLLSECTSAGEESLSESSKPRLTELKNVQHTLSTIQKFVSKYQPNIGSHPFLAGLYRIVDMQLNPKNRRSASDSSYVVRWAFRGSVLTEACRSCGKDKDDELAYAREAIEVLFSFLTWVCVKDVDVEGGVLIVPVEDNGANVDHILQSSNHGGDEEHNEPNLLFEVDKHVSNANLRRILSILPNPKRLDARATGSVEVLDASDSDGDDIDGGSRVVPRKNVAGREDEQWPWFARFEFCTLL